MRSHINVVLRLVSAVSVAIGSVVVAPAQWSRIAIPSGAPVRRYIQASSERSYCMSGGHIYSRLNDGIWHPTTLPRFTQAGTQWSAWNDTVVAWGRFGGSLNRLVYSFDAGATWKIATFDRPSSLDFVPHSTTIVTARHRLADRGHATRIDYVTGEIQSFQYDPEQRPGDPTTLYSDGSFFIRRKTIDTAANLVELFRVTMRGNDTSQWAVSLDTAIGMPIVVPGAGVVLPRGSRYIHRLGDKVDTLLVPMPYSSFAALVGHNGKWLARVVEDRTTRIISSVNGRDWTPLPHDIASLLHFRSTMYSLNNRTLVFTDQDHNLLEFSGLTGVTTSISDGLSSRAQVATDGRYLAMARTAYASDVGRLLQHVDVIDDAQDPPDIRTITLPRLSAVKIQCVDGLIWVMSDSVYAFRADNGERELSIPTLPLQGGAFAVSDASVLRATAVSVERWKRSDATLQTIVSFPESDISERDGLCHVDDGFYVTSYRWRGMRYPFGELVVTKYSIDGDTLIPPYVIDTVDMHTSYVIPKLDPIQDGVAITARDRVMGIIRDDGTAFSYREVREAYVAAASLLWERDSELSLRSSTGLIKHVRSYRLPARPQFSPYEWFCLVNRCYLTTDVGVFSAPFEKGATTVQETAVLTELAVSAEGVVMAPYAGNLSVMDLQGRVMYACYVQHGHHMLQPLSHGVYSATLVGTGGQVQRVVFVR